MKKELLDNIERLKEAKKARAKTETITFRCTKQEKLDFMGKVSDPSELLRDFINQYKK